MNPEFITKNIHIYDKICNEKKRREKKEIYIKVSITLK
jgi:hypothetical protein